MLSDLSGGDLATVLVSIVIALSIHEAMHGYVAHWLGDRTAHEAGRLTLNPLVHIDAFTTVLLPMVLILSHLPPIFAAKPVPFNPARLKYDEFGAALVGAAGPLTNFVLAAVAALVLRGWGADFNLGVVHAILIFIQVNIGFFVFNLIPIPPLDGSRVLYAFAPEPVQRFMEQIEAMGFLVILFIFIFAFQFISGPIVNIQQSILNFLLV
jgi:Zn-dependent protease